MEKVLDHEYYWRTKYLRIRDKKGDFHLGMNILTLIAFMGVVALPIMLILKLGWYLLFFGVCYVFVMLFHSQIAKSIRRSPMNIFKVVDRFFDLEERHGALIKFLKLKETLIPRHWKVEKVK